ncbi:23S rRNA (adenine(2030)-N(6))-methyltransferase RlmJ [Aureimonas populi]|uniref:Ribosomal RNA large subunit methyltransferase J n=1 Tax=Aureimonas populi TaxID=1701758 RepID=A0ABW5CFL5_9HYPH|nr:23S rRNA (adenine(2030)-N(6))-methyltransferase RlmJ [Aureimonas populi]
MNYRHAFHAGNFADVVKHALLARLVAYLKRKEKPFRVIDTHAGRGRYDLSGEEARRTGEHLGGITALLASPAAGHPLLADYLAVVREVTAQAQGAAYPGSPLLARRLLRRQDRLSAYELHPVDAKALAAEFAGDVQVKAIELDGWLALGAHVPPKEKRGLVLIDPPFEEGGETERIVQTVARAHRRWPGGTYAIWYPIKRPAEREKLHRLLRESGMPDVLAAEFFREGFTPGETLVGSGLAVVNPPFVFAQEATDIMKALLPVLGVNESAHCGIIALASEAG